MGPQDLGDFGAGRLEPDVDSRLDRAHRIPEFGSNVCVGTPVKMDVNDRVPLRCGHALQRMLGLPTRHEPSEPPVADDRRFVDDLAKPLRAARCFRYAAESCSASSARALRSSPADTGASSARFAVC